MRQMSDDSEADNKLATAHYREAKPRSGTQHLWIIQVTTRGAD
jgi:hypothetical protein